MGLLGREVGTVWAGLDKLKQISAQGKTKWKWNILLNFQIPFIKYKPFWIQNEFNFCMVPTCTIKYKSTHHHKRKYTVTWMQQIIIYLPKKIIFGVSFLWEK
jgi:hypothetical protein